MVNIAKTAKRVIEENPVAFATVDKKGRPNAIGVAFVKVVSRNQAHITDNYMRQTKENLSKNRNVCLAVWDRKWNGYKLIGKARYYTSGKWKKFVEAMPENKGLPAKGALIVTVSKIISLK